MHIAHTKRKKIKVNSPQKIVGAATLKCYGYVMGKNLLDWEYCSCSTIAGTGCGSAHTCRQNCNTVISGRDRQFSTVLAI